MGACSTGGKQETLQNPEKWNERTLRWSLGPYLLLILFTTTALHAQAESPVTRLTTEDGTRFLLVPTGGPPVIHWVAVAPAGILEDPVGLPGLSHAAVLASLEGTDRIGSLDPAGEAAILQEIDRLEQEVAALRRRSADPDPEFEGRLTEARRAAARLSDPAAWWRLLLTAPASAMRHELLHDGAVFSLTTTIVGLSRVAPLIHERRERSVLRGVEAELRQIQDQAATLRTSTSLAELRGEALALAFAGHPYGHLWARPGPSAPLNRRKALQVWRRIQRPERGLHVLVGGFSLEEVRPLLESTFRDSRLDDETPPPQLQIVRSSSTRRAVVPGGNTAAMVIGFPLPIDTDHNTLQAVTRWIAGGADSFLSRGLRDRGYRDFRVEGLAPFPSPGNMETGLLLIEIEVAAGDPAARDQDALQAHIRGLLGLAQREGPLAVDLDPIVAEMRSRHTSVRGAGDSIAYELAVQCGLMGRTPEQVLGPFRAPTRSDCMALLRILDRRGVIEVQWELGS